MGIFDKYSIYRSYYQEFYRDYNSNGKYQPTRSKKLKNKRLKKKGKRK